MAVTLDATVGGEAANSYVAYADAVAYLGARLNATAWEDAGATDRTKALVTATRLLDSFTYKGVKSDTAQALKWPREGTVDDDGEEYASDAIPSPVADATCIVALALLASGTTDALAPVPVSGIAALKSGDDAIAFRDRTAGAAGTTLGAGWLPPDAQRLVAHLMLTPPGSGRVVRAA
ncbi:MAG: DnaT-like ssDNA-binding protein [Georgenia sp.]